MDEKIFNLIEALKNITNDHQEKINELGARIMVARFDRYHSLTIEELSEEFENMELEALEYITNFAKEINDLDVYEIARPILDQKKDFAEALPLSLEEEIETKIKKIWDRVALFKDILGDDMFMQLNTATPYKLSLSN